MKSVLVRKLFLAVVVTMIFFGFKGLAYADTEYGNLSGDTGQRISNSFEHLIQTLGTHLTGTLTQIDIRSSNPSFDYYGVRPYFTLIECDDSTYGSSTLDGSNCIRVYEALSGSMSQFASSTQSFYPDGVTLDPSKYYFFTLQGNNIFNALPYYYGSSSDVVDGACYQYNISSNPLTPCTDAADLYFDLHGISKVSPPVPVGNSNVLFIPGLEASRLYKPSSGGGESQLWEPGGNGDAVQLVSQADGTSINPDIYTKDIINETNRPVPLVGFLGQNIYKSFSAMMDGLVSSDKIVAWQSYAYDWRQSVQDIVDNGTKRDNGVYKLTDALTSLASASKSGKVTIVAHSNGGLIAKALLKKLEDDKTAGRNNLIDKIDTVILVATPQWGTPSTIPSILHGYDQGIALNVLLNPMTARELARNMPGVYGLLPSAEYFNHVNNPAVTFVQNTLDPWMSQEIFNYGKNITTYSTLKNFLSGSEGRSEPTFSTDTLQPIKGNSLLLNQAEDLHNFIDTMTVPSSIRVVQIAGWGLDTVASFQYNASSTCSYLTDNGCTGSYILDERPIFTSDGDRVVVTPSALAMSGEKYWVDLPIYNRQLRNLRINREHKNILEINELDNLINQIITNDTITFNSVLKGTKPTDDSNHLRLSVHSPVTLEVYDVDGNRTGKICPPTTDLCYTEENISNSSYYEFGEGKYLNLPQDALQKVVLQGTDVGTFTFDSEVVTPNGDTTTSSFMNIPVTPQTQAEVTLDATGTPQLKLDVTGDGVIDFTLAPTTVFDPITYLQIMNATVDSLDLTQAKKTAFGNRVDNIIKSIQKGKIDKAKLKAEKFQTVLENRLAKPDPKKPKPKNLSKTDAQTLLDMLNQLLDNIS